MGKHVAKYMIRHLDPKGLGLTPRVFVGPLVFRGVCIYHYSHF